MLRVLLILLLVAALGPQAALAQARYCSSTVRDESGQEVTATATIEDGAISSRQVLWSLPITSTRNDFRAELEINYFSRTEIIPEENTGVTIITEAQGNTDLRNATSVIRLANGQSWSAPFHLAAFFGFSQLALGPPWGNQNLDLIHAIDSARGVEVTVQTEDGHRLASATIDPSHHEIRDRIRAEALQQAEQRAISSDHC